MFGLKRMKDNINWLKKKNSNRFDEIMELMEDVAKLKKRVREVENPAVGECFGFVGGLFVNGYHEWFKIYKNQVEDEVANKVKIGGEWIDRGQVIFYNDISKQKKKVEKKYKPKEE